MMRTVPLQVYAGRLAGIDRMMVIIVVTRVMMVSTAAATVVDERGSDGRNMTAGPDEPGREHDPFVFRR
jgi:hypothetical protein